TFASPDKASVALNETVTFELFHPLVLAEGDWTAVITGGVLSILTEGDLKVALLSALSVTVTVSLTDDPSAANNNGLDTELDATPDRLSAGVKLNVTFVLFQPAAFGAGEGVPNATVGGVISVLMPIRV